MKVALFITCLTDTFYPRVGVAIVRILEHLGHTVEFPTAQTCCGQPMFNNGYHGEARDLARRMIRVFRASETIVTPSGSCAAMVREQFLHLFPEGTPEHDDVVALAGRTWEFVEFLTRRLHVDLCELGVRWTGAATYHYSCHLRGLNLGPDIQPIVSQIEGLDYRPLDRIEECCGFGGTFAVKFPQISGVMVEDKVNCIQETGASHVIVNDAGCAMNISGACRRNRCNVRVISLAEIIAEGLGLLDREEETA